MSPHSTVVGTGGLNRLRTRSGRAGASGSETVVLFDDRGRKPRKPSSRMPFGTERPLAPDHSGGSSAFTRRQPNVRPLPSHRAATTSLSPASGSRRPPASSHE